MLSIDACARSGEWSHALRLFVDMKVDRVRYDLVTYNALAAAFSNGGQPDLVRYGIRALLQVAFNFSHS